ncbi:peptidoglycan-binding protein [Planktothrix sp. FACHB-1355]|uniref:Peptidoglycan-binding protein n=1 Tax=Aerosakkonema funiforme FACHB-1375 TaxID=2949571 RepID=A0A926VNQ4_9CYAN|nr:MULTISPECIES: peptidoglycan-binding protein [Oscillatoriales]MBD2185834.1 peptidoglycan-binding protein [Aerosakkonema funiforme FACHB-1375]MBD3560695.1 peptidoglycan-binding protein [Planktothrix sp. FACHB-1355]
MENLVYIHLASSYDAAEASQDTGSPKLLKVSQHKVNWKKVYRRVWINLVSIAIASVGLGIAGQAMAELRQGSKGPDVLELQEQLTQLGYFNRRPTGSFGPLTKSAVIRFQQNEGLRPNGIVEEQTQQRLQEKIAGTEKAAPASVETVSSRRTLKKGAKGSEVSYLQQLLSDAGVYDGEINGNFDSQTHASVKQFQRYSGLKVDGIVGKRTWTTLVDGDKQTSNQPFDNSPFTNESAFGQPTGQPINAPVLRQGDKGEGVKDLQDRLRDLGYFKSRSTGAFGSVTKAAVIRFQRDKGLRPDGIVDKKTQAALETSSSTSNLDVSELQERLKEKGFYQGPIDGNFNAQTRSAVKAAQRAYGINERDILKVGF